MSTIPRRPSMDSRLDTPQHPDPLQEATELAEAGDFGAALSCFISSDQGRYSLHQLDALLRQAISRAGEQSPQQFARTVFGHNTIYIQYILLRLQACSLHALHEADARSTQRRDE